MLQSQRATPPQSIIATSLATGQQLRPCRQVWYDPLTRKKFSSEAKYREATGSKKYQELVRRSGAPAPEPIVTLRKTAAAGASMVPVHDKQAQQLRRETRARIVAAALSLNCSATPLYHGWKRGLIWPSAQSRGPSSPAWTRTQDGQAWTCPRTAYGRRSFCKGPATSAGAGIYVLTRVHHSAGAEQPSQSAVTTTAQQPLPAPGYVVKPVLQTGVLRLDHNGLPAASGQVRQLACNVPPELAAAWSLM